MGDLDLPIRDRIYREPDGPHVLICRGRQLEDAIDHLAVRPDCRAIAVLGVPPYDPPDLRALEGRRFLVADADRSRARAYAEAGLRAGADVEWEYQERPSLDRIAAWALPVGAVVLAAGVGRRMGKQKLLLDFAGKPLVMHALEAASDGGCHRVVVVYSDEAVADAVGTRARCVFNADAASGLASSLRVGLDAIDDGMAGALVMLGDQPMIGARTVSMLLRAWRREGARLAAATGYPGDDGRGPRWRPPVLLDRSLWPELRALTGDNGARQLLSERPEIVDVVPSDDLPHDVDTPEDYAKIVKLFPPRRRA